MHNSQDVRQSRITNKAIERMQRLTQLETIDGNMPISNDARSIAAVSVNLKSDK
jgi:hypothetical protein